MNNELRKNKNSGQVMLLTVLILSSTILGASTIVGFLLLNQIKTSTDIKNSTKAIFAADAGIEYELYRIAKDPSHAFPTFTNGAVLTTTCNPSGGGIAIKSTGEVGRVARAFQADLPGTPPPCPPPL